MDPSKMTAQAAPPTEEEELARRLVGHRSAQLLSAAVRLGIPAALESGVSTVADLARAVDAAPAALGGALEGLVAEGVVDRPEPGRYRLTGLGRRLLPDAPGGLAALAREVGEVDYGTWGELLHRLTTDGSAFERAHGRSWFEDRANREPGLFRRMAATARPVAEAVAERTDLSGLGLVDVGGGAGGFLLTLLALVPDATGVVFDLEAVRPEAERALAAAGLGSRCRFASGSFFDAVPPGGNRYLLVRVLRNWGDAEAAALLRTVAQAAALSAGPGALQTGRRRGPRKAPRLLLVDPVPAEPYRPPPLELGGRRQLRTRSELAALLAEAGWEMARIRSLGEWGHLVEAARSAAK